MSIRILYATVAAALLLTTNAGWAYDSQLAASYAEMFAPVAGAKAGKEMHLIKVDAFVDGVKAGKEYVTLDVRTPAEAGIFTMSLPNSIAIPVSELFRSENLDRLPTDKPVVVVCKSGTRASAVGTALRHTGFDNVLILKGGLKALTAYLDPKTSNTPVEKVAMH
jgi:rhodanese-related sulfurtransferase